MVLELGFFCVCDANGKIRKMWGGYSPKVYGSHFVLMPEQRDWFTSKCFNSGHKIAIIADSHFSMVKKEMKKIVKWHTPPTEEEVEALAIKDYRKKISQVHARIESPFGIMKGKFAASTLVFQKKSSNLNVLCGLLQEYIIN